jgi:hypothetical protein
MLTAFAGTALASGESPVSNDDSTTVQRGATVSVLDSGESSVLANDFDPEDDALIALLTRNPKHGELNLNQDGTFIYRHDGSSKNGDEFRYRAFDGTSFSDEATVKIRISPADPVPPEIVGQREVTVPEDESVRIRLQDLEVTDPDSDYPQDFTLQVEDGVNYTRIDSTITPVANFNGQLTVPVRVNDGTNFSNWFDLLVDVTPVNDAPFVVGEVPDQEAMENVEFILSLAEFFDDIDEGDSLGFSAQGLPSSGTLVLDGETGVLRGTTIRSDARDTPYLVQVTATDAAGSSAQLTFALTVFANNNADIAVSGSVMANPVLVGDPLMWNIDVWNLGPAQLAEGELVSSWTTSGSTLSLTATAGCSIESNNSPAPTMRCPFTQLSAGTALSFDVQGMQDGDGDNTMIATVVADDPVTDNNATLVSAQVAAALSEGAAQILTRAGADIAAADFNSDGLLDLVATDTQTIVYLNTGNRSVQATGITIGSGGSLLTILDWNGDGLHDVAVAGPSASAARVYLGDGAGSFPDSIDIFTRVQGEAAALQALDVESNGTHELLLGGTFGTLIASAQATGQTRIDLLPGGAVLDVAVTNLDQDGFADIVSVAADDRSVRLLRNTQNGNFVLQRSIQQGSVARVSVADLDEDGWSDLLLAIDGYDLSPPHTTLMLRQSDGTYVVGDILGATVASELLTGDINGDGQPDIVAVNDSGVHQVYVAGTGGGYDIDAEQIVSPGMQRGIVVDFNADDSLDLVLAGTGAGVIELHANNGIGRLGPGDRTAPELTLIGAAELTVPSGSQYVDAGATAIDDIDGDLTDAITTSGNVNTAVVGTYTVTYTVSDRASNASQVTRRVTVGVNQGTGGGGGGGGMLSPLALSVLAMFASMISLIGNDLYRRRK